MAVREIRIIGDPILRTPTDWIEEVDEKVESLVEDLLETVALDGRAGLAAPQIGVGLRAFAWNIDGEIDYILNPKIVEVSEDEFQDGEEGCLSIPGLFYDVERHWYAKVEGIDLDGNKKVIAGEGLMARALQHENDHLEGILFIDRLDRPTKRKAYKDIRKANF